VAMLIIFAFILAVLYNGKLFAFVYVFNLYYFRFLLKMHFDFLYMFCSCLWSERL